MPGRSGKPVRIRVIHWRAEESGPLVEACRSCGFAVEYRSGRYPEIARAVRESPPDAIAIDLSRLPSHGREVAVAFRNAKYSRHIPLVFVGGASEKIEAIRGLLPDAAFTSVKGICGSVRAALRNSRARTVPPAAVPMKDRYGARTVAEKLGIKEEMQAGLLDAPRDYAAVVGDLPRGAALVEDPGEVHPVTLWFVREPGDYQAALPKMRRLAARTRLWIVWKKEELRLTGNAVREYANQAGLVDYKICALGRQWSGMLFAVRKS